uniref:Basigin n=2 Tax=Lygus hesperus TaxID=30085 RepID=A0A0A9W6U6_LYGHE
MVPSIMENSFIFVLLGIIVAVTDGADEVNPLTAEYDFGTTRVLDYKVSNTLKCNISGKVKGPPLPFAWLKDDMELENNKKYRIANNHLTIFRTTEEDIARYTCVLIKENKAYAARMDIHTLGKPTAKIISQGTFIQGQKIRLECVTQGKPIPTIQWRFGNETFKTSNGRVKLSESDKVPNAILTIESAEMSDRGDYYCQASNTATKELNITVETSSYVRVKDKLAALWPFIGICAEVIVLCAIIFVYERKRNKAEMDESDTDISPDQKNTPDHGKDSVRQRK